jgi:hypothetical protein
LDRSSVAAQQHHPPIQLLKLVEFEELDRSFPLVPEQLPAMAEDQVP